MTDSGIDENLEAEQQVNGADAVENDSERWRSASFIGIFVVIILTLLSAYRYAIDTRLNDWYLFTVAKHTAMTLNFIGHSAKLEDMRRLQISPAEARASMELWLSDLDSTSDVSPSHEAISAASNEPLTAWEFWSYRAIKKRKFQTPGIDGPHVSYIWRPGLNTYLRDKQLERETLINTQATLNDEVKNRITVLSEEIAALQQEQTELLKDPEAYKAKSERLFNFVVIPECGAIEIMGIFLAAVLAFPTSARKRIFGAVIGIPLMYLVNIFRLTCLGMIGAIDQGGKWFTFTHEYLWQVVYIIFVVVVWLLWVEFVVRRRED